MMKSREGESDMYEIVKDYRDNKTLRDSFNALAEKTFGLNFEGWYQNGFWGDNYNPHSIVLGGKVVANVSVNRTDLLIGGIRKRLYQLGTVMTDESYRGRGLIRAIMAEVDKTTADADGVYLFGNDSVVEFYPKFGFRKGKEYRYSKTVTQTGGSAMENIPMDNAQQWALLDRAMAENVCTFGCEMVDNPQLIFFYVSQFMQDCVYYCGALDAWAVAELEDGNLTLHNVFSKQAITLDAVIGAFGSEIKNVTLGFAPDDAAGWTAEEFHEEDCTFFTKGKAFEDFAGKKLRIPTLTHA